MESSNTNDFDDARGDLAFVRSGDGPDDTTPNPAISGKQFLLKIIGFTLVGCVMYSLMGGFLLGESSFIAPSRAKRFWIPLFAAFCSNGLGRNN